MMSERAATVGGYQLMNTQDAVSAGAGAMVGLVSFSSCRKDFLCGIFVIGLLLITMSTPDIIDLEHQYSLYLSYNRHKVSKFAITLAVWPLVWSGQVLFSYTAHWASLLTVLYVLYYMAIKRNPVNYFTCVVLCASNIAAGELVEVYPDAYLYAMYVQIGAWVALILSWIMFELDNPGMLKVLMTNFHLAILVAPLFVLIEASISFGYNLKFDAEARLQIDYVLRQARNDQPFEKK